VEEEAFALSAAWPLLEEEEEEEEEEKGNAIAAEAAATGSPPPRSGESTADPIATSACCYSPALARRQQPPVRQKRPINGKVVQKEVKERYKRALSTPQKRAASSLTKEPYQV